MRVTVRKLQGSGKTTPGQARVVLDSVPLGAEFTPDGLESTSGLSHVPIMREIDKRVSTGELVRRPLLRPDVKDYSELFSLHVDPTKRVKYEPYRYFYRKVRDSSPP